MAVSRLKSWYAIRAARTTAELRIYEEIGLWGISARELVNDLTALGELTRLDVRIHSPGGDFYDALAIHNALARNPAVVTTHIDGLCASAATIVALAGDQVCMANNGQFMIHEPWTMTSGDAEDHQRRADLLDATAEQIVAIYARKSGQTPDQIRAWMRAETWMTAPQALEYGFIDIIDAPLKIAAQVFDLSRFSHPPPKVSAMSESETPETIPATEPPPADPAETPPDDSLAEIPGAEAARPVDAVALAQACLDAGEPDLIPALLAAPVSMDALQARIAQASEVRKLCAMARQPERAAELIRAGLTTDQAKARLWDAIVAADRAIGAIDATPPAPRKPITDPTLLARAALSYQQAQKTAGLDVSYAEAVAHIAKTGVPS